MLPCHPKILAGETMGDFCTSFEDGLTVALLSSTKGKMKKNLPQNLG